MRNVVCNLSLLSGLIANSPTLYDPNRLEQLFRGLSVTDNINSLARKNAIPVYCYLIPMDDNGNIYLDSYRTKACEYTEWFRGGMVEPIFEYGTLQPECMFDAISSTGDRVMFKRWKMSLVTTVHNDEFDDLYNHAKVYWNDSFDISMEHPSTRKQLFFVTYLIDEYDNTSITQYNAGLVIYVVYPIRESDVCFDWPIFDAKAMLNRIDRRRPDFIPASKLKFLSEVDSERAHFCPLSMSFIDVIRENYQKWRESI